MKHLVVVLFFASLVSCTDDNYEVLTGAMDNPLIMNVFCQSNPNEYYRHVEYKYNDNRDLISETTLQNGETYRRTLEYRSDGQLMKEVYDMILDKQEKEFVYNEANQLKKIIHTFIHYHSDGQIETESESETIFEYERLISKRSGLLGWF
jgi:antitoxin component YwqK of YwqJK toxin-antitoxin module